MRIALPSPDEKLLEKHCTPDSRFGAQAFGCPIWSARGTRLARLPQSFLSSSRATVRAARTEAVKEKSAGLVRPAGTAKDGAPRIDCAQVWATVVDRILEKGKRLDTAAKASLRRTAWQANRTDPKLEVGWPCQSEELGNNGCPEGARPAHQARCEHDSATGHLAKGRGRPATREQ